MNTITIDPTDPALIEALSNAPIYRKNVTVKARPGMSRHRSPAATRRSTACLGLLAPYALPIVALGPASSVTYHALTGAHHDSWTPWMPDRIEAAS